MILSIIQEIPLFVNRPPLENGQTGSSASTVCNSSGFVVGTGVPDGPHADSQCRREGTETLPYDRKSAGKKCLIFKHARLVIKVCRQAQVVLFS